MADFRDDFFNSGAWNTAQNVASADYQRQKALEEKYNNAKNEMWGDSGILGNIERLRDTFVNTTGSMLRGADISDFTNEWGKEMQDNASLRMANLPKGVDMPHGQGVGAWLSYLSDIDRGALPQVTNVLGSATAMLGPTAISMIPIGRGASLAAKGLSKVPAIARGLENSKGIQQILKDITMGGVSAQYESLAEKGDNIRTLEEMGYSHEEAVQEAEKVRQENQALLTATNMAESALANPILRKLFPAFNAVGDDIVTGAKTAANLSARASAIRNAINKVPTPIANGVKVGGSVGANTLMNGYEEGVQNQIQEAHTPTVDENGNFVFKDYDVNDLINPSQWSEGSWKAAEEGAVGAAGLSVFGHGAGAVRNRLFNRPNTDVDTIDTPQSDNGIPLYNDQHYIITDQVSNPNATEDTLARLNALAHDYEEQFGEKLMVTSLRRDGNGDSWHDSGQAIDIAGGGLETNENGEREWLLKRGEELGLTGLDEYAHPSDHASGGHIHFSNHNDGGEYTKADNTNSDFDTFMAKVGLQESGGNYDAVNSDSGASGKYQIMPENWGAWAEGAGLDPNSEMTPENQEIVARNKLKQYYDKYGEKGALVAWYAGEANAERYVNGLETDIWGREWTAPQDNAPSIQSYVDEALSRNVGGKSSKGGKTSSDTQIKDTPLEDYLKLFDDGKTENKTYDDYVKLIGNATDEQVMENAEKAKEEATKNGDIDTYTALDDMISNGDVEGLRNFALSQAQSLNNSEVVSEVNEVTTADDVQTEPVKTFDFSEAIDGLRNIAQTGTPEQQQIAQNAISSNAPLVALQAYNHLSNLGTADAENTVGTEDNIAIGEAINQSANNEPSTNLNQWRDIRNNATERVRQRTSNNAQQIAQQQADNLYSNAPLTAQEQATTNSVLNSANGVFSDNIKNELFNALRNGDNASVRRVINGVPNNIPSQADVNQQAMAELDKIMSNKNLPMVSSRLNINRATHRNSDYVNDFMQSLDEDEREFINILQDIFYETGRAFKDIAYLAKYQIEQLQEQIKNSNDEKEIENYNSMIELRLNVLKRMNDIAQKAYDFNNEGDKSNENRRKEGYAETVNQYERQRPELPAESRESTQSSTKYLQQKNVPKLNFKGNNYGVQLKNRLLDNNVPINEKAVDKSLNSENQKEVDHVVERMENIAEKNNVDIADIKQEAKAKKTTPNRGTSSNAKKENAKNAPSKKSDVTKTTTTEKKNTPKTTLSEQESREGVASEPQKETPSDKNKPALNRKSESQKSEKKPKTTSEDNSKVKMVKESEETVSKAEIVGEKIRDDFMSKDMKDTVSTFLPVIRQKLNQFFMSAKPHKDKKHDSIYGGRTIEEVRNKMERLAKSIVNLVDTLSDFTADEKQVMKEVLQSQCNTVIDKAIKQIKDSNTKLAVDTTPEGIQKQAKINREKQLELVKTEFPTATNIVQNEDSIRFNLNDEKVRVNYVDRVIATEERKQAYRKDYGEEYTDDVSILGDTQTINGEQVITLLNRIGYEDTISHEAFHLAFRTALTKAQQKILLDKYGNEEAVAEAYRKLMNKSNARGTMFDMTSSIGRLFQKIWNFANSLFNVFNNGCMLHDAESIMYAIADGSIYELNEKNEKGIVAFLHPALLAAWHGSPHLFDKFSTDSIGSGQGAISHGWGLYFALNKKVSERYKYELTNKTRLGVNIDGKQYYKQEDKEGDEENWVDENGEVVWNDDAKFADWFAENEYDKRKTIEALNAHKTAINAEYIQRMLSYFDKHDVKRSEKGALYQVDIPSTDTMLREDKPFSEQPKQVQDALEKMWKEYKDSNTYSYKQNDDKYDVYMGDELLDTYDNEELAKQAVDENTNSTHIKKLSNFIDGKEILSYVRKNLYYFTHDYEFHSSDKGASLWLNKYGIEGISYHGGQDGECCVVFNDKAVKILERNGEPVSDNNTKLRAIKNTDSQLEAVRKQYEGTDQWLKAPNGKDTNLTERQWLQVRTPNFKNWFGDWENDPENASKVVDENGEPLVVYHGSDKNFDVFDASKTRSSMDIQGSFFSSWSEDAMGYGNNVRAFFLNIKNPANSAKGYKALNTYKGQKEAGIKARDLLAKQGFDGVNNDNEEYIVFESNQIKSATDNSGEFSTENDNIKYSRAVPNPNSAENLKKNGDTDTRLDKLPKVNVSKLTKGEKAIQQFGKSLGIPVHFVVHPDKGFRGVFTHNGEIFINRNSSVPVKDVFVHEFVHWLKASENEAIFDSLSACLENLKGVSHAKRLSEYRKSIFNGENMTDNEIIEEMICDAISHTETANKLFNAINDINPSMAEKVLGYMKNVWDKFCSAVGYNQGKFVAEQKLPNGLSASEMAKINATLNKQLTNIKGKDGKPVFAFKDGKFVVAKTGKEIGESFNAEPITNTIESQSNQDGFSDTDEQLEEVRQKYQSKPQWLKAPNGKPTNLTEQQWLQVRTPNFKNWFGDWENDPANASKVVDENGEPLVVYHGTVDKPFDTFKKDMVGNRYSYDEKGFFFTDKESVANDYAHSEFNSDVYGGIIPVFISSPRALVIDNNWVKKQGMGKIFKEKDAIEFWDTYQSLALEEAEKVSVDGIVINDGTSRMVVVFEPNQIKSATDNSGEFSTENDNIKYSRSKPTEETASSDTKGMFQKATKALAERLGIRVEADRNVTVNRKSTNPQDINVLNRIFNSPSYIARYNKLLAPLVSMAKSAVDKQEKLRYEFREALNDVEKILGYNKWSKNSSEYKANKEALNEILINGDMANREYSNEELRKQGYNEQVIKAYTKMRQTLNKAWKMLDDVTSRMKFGTRNLTEGELVDLKNSNPFLEITSVSSETDENGRKKYTYKYPSVDNITEHLLKPELDELKKNPDVKVISADKLSGGEYIVKYVQRRRIGKIEGYVPHIFHEWSVVEVDNNGKILKEENGNSKFLKTFNSMNDAIKFANKQDKSKKYKVMPKLHEVPGASERSAIIEDYNYLKIMDKVVEDFTLTPSEAVDLMNSGIKTGTRGRFLGNLMKRKGVDGYEKDMMYATYQYFNQVGRYVALDPFKRLAYSLYEKQFGKWEDEKVYNGELGQSAKWAKMYINAVNGVPTDVEKNINNALHAIGLGKDVAGGRPAIWLAHAMTYPMTIAKLGVLNVSSALLNITQLANLFGAMGDMSKDNLLRVANNAVRMYWQAWKNPDSQTGKLLWKDLGLRYQLGMDVAGGYSRAETDGFVHSRAGLISKYSGGLAELQARISKLAGVSMFMFRGTDSFGRGVTLLTAYQKARDEGKTHVEAVRYAKMINDRVNFDYSVADANGIYNQLSVLATIALQFQKYPIKQIELFYDIFKEQRILNKDKSFTNARALAALGKYMMPYMALSGIAGVPFIGLASALLGFASDDDRDLVEKIRAYLRENYGEKYPTLVNMASYGLLGGIGINTGSRIGIGDFLAGNANIKKTKIEIAVETFFGTLASTAMQTHKQLQNGNYVEALKAINPSVGNIATAYKGEVRTTRGRLKYTYADNYERFIRALGFTPVGETLASEQASEDYYNRQQEQAEKQAAIDEFIAHPNQENANKLNELGITPKSIQTERERKGKNRHEINEETKKKKEDKQKKDQAKGKKPKVYTVQDYQRAIKK